MDTVKQVERAVLAVAVALLPLLVYLGWLDAGGASVVGGVLASLSAGLRLPAAATAVQYKRSGAPRGKRRQNDLEAEIGQVAQRIIDQLRARESAVDNVHGDRPSS